MPDDLADAEDRPTAHLGVDPADVLADEADREEQDADEGEEDREEREHALALRPDDQAPNEEEEREGLDISSHGETAYSK